MSFFHGTETKEFRDGPTPVTVVKSAVVAVVGTAPAGPVNQTTLLLTDADHAQFGPELEGFTIPQQLKAIRDFGAGTVIVVNVLNPSTHKEAVEEEHLTFDAVTGLGKLANGAASSIVLKNQAGNTTYVLGTDYEIVDALKGIIKKKGTNIPSGGAYADYEYLDPTAVIAADIIGEVGSGGIRTGLQALMGTYTKFGLKAKLITSPVYSTQNTVRAAMDVIATQLRAIAFADAPVGTTPAQAITGRGPSGAINFNTSSARMMLCYPHLKVYDLLTDSLRLEPYSARLVGAICLTDVTDGFWYSPSNRELKGVVGVERDIVAEYNADCEANQLNAVGITTIMNTFGTGLRVWGNRTAAYPQDTHPLNFLPVRRTADIIEESIELAAAKYVDLPGSKVNITTVEATASEFIRDLVRRGAILDGRVWFDPQKNSQVQMANGQYVFCYDFMPPTPMERITWEAIINMNYLSQLAASLAT